MMPFVSAPHRDPPLNHHPLFWDALVVLSIVIPVIAGYLSWTAVRSPWSEIFSLLLGIGILLVIYGSFIEPRRISLNKKFIHISSLPDITIAVIADFHVGPYKRTKYVEKVVKNVMKLKPDMIVLPGDFIFDHRSDALHLKPLKKLNAPLGVYASMGNHDSGHHLTGGALKSKGRESYQTKDRADEITTLLQSLGIIVLRNASKTLTKDGTKFMVAGIDDVWMESCDLSGTLDKADKKLPIILLAHNPDVLLKKEHARASLIVCGHTHGGQVRLPLIGAVADIPNTLGKKYDQGIFTLKNGTTLAITHGIGETMGRMRLFCPPEILLLVNSR